MASWLKVRIPSRRSLLSIFLGSFLVVPAAYSQEHTCNADAGGLDITTFRHENLTFRWHNPYDSSGKGPRAFDANRQNILIYAHGFHARNAKQTWKVEYMTPENVIDFAFTGISQSLNGEDLASRMQCGHTGRDPLAEVVKSNSCSQSPDNTFNVGVFDWSEAALGETKLADLEEAENRVHGVVSAGAISDEAIKTLLWRALAPVNEADGDKRVIILGHSLGGSLAIRIYSQIVEMVRAKDPNRPLKAGLIPDSVIIADPYWRRGGVLGTGFWPGKKVREAWMETNKMVIRELGHESPGLLFVNAPGDGVEAFGDENKELKRLGAYMRFNVGLKPGMDLFQQAARIHMFPLYWCLHSLAFNETPNVESSEGKRVDGVSCASSGADLRRVQSAGIWYDQIKGDDSVILSDDVFKAKTW